MKAITLRLRDRHAGAIDASSVRLDELAVKSDREIARQSISVSSVTVELGAIFQVNTRETNAEQPTLTLQGDCRSVHRLGHQHRAGRIVIEADIGDYCGSCMSGGTITVRGSAGHMLGAPTGSRGVGMNGGRIVVAGSVGGFAGHRMRRGEIWIAENAGDSLASWQVAGTIGVGGAVGVHVGYGMRRGTLILGTAVALSRTRFSAPVELETPFRSLLLDRPEMQSIWPPATRGGECREWLASRGDRSIGGIGEIWYPHVAPSLAH